MNTGSETETDRLIPVSEAARALGWPEATLRRLVSKGRLPSTSLAGIRRVRLSQLRSLLSERLPAA